MESLPSIKGQGYLCMDIPTPKRKKARFWTSVNKRRYAVLLGGISRLWRLSFSEATMGRDIEPGTCHPRATLYRCEMNVAIGSQAGHRVGATAGALHS
jgi:hypothetical protein